MMKRQLLAIITGAIAIIALSACSGGVAPGTVAPERQTINDVDTVRVVASSQPVGYTTSGSVKAATTATLSGKAMGSVKNILVAEGDMVKAGQLLIVIDDRDIMARIKQAEAVLIEAQNAQTEVEAATVAAEKGLLAASAQRKLLDATYERFQNLYQKQSVSAQEFDEIKAKWEAAQAQEAQARAMMDSVAAKKGQVRGKISQAKAAVSEANSYLSYTRIRAPFAGRMVKKMTEIGSVVAPGMPLLVVERDQRYQLIAGVDESKLGQLRLNQPVTVTIPAVNFQSDQCLIEEITGTVDPMSRTVAIKISLPDWDRMQSGLYGQAEITIGQSTSLLVPDSSILRRGALEGVFVLNEDRVLQWRLVKTGKSSGNRTEIISGIEPGEEIVARDVQRMVDGARAEVRS